MKVDKILTRDLSWREAELASLKLEVSDADGGSVKERALLRALWAMLYAHYEGFSVFAWTVYLDEIENLRIVKEDLPYELQCLSLSAEINRIKSNMSGAEIVQFAKQGLPGLLSAPAIFPEKLEAASNLHPILFRENSKKVCLPHRHLDENELRIKLLVKRRNAIAHGENIIVKDLAEYQGYESAALLVMHELAIGIVESLHVLSAKSPIRQLSFL